MPQLEPVPYSAPILQNGKDLVSAPWYQWFFGLTERVGETAQAVETTSLSTQSASIGATPMLVTSYSGLYRVSVYLRITRAATVSSAATVTIGWTETAVPLTFSFPAVTGNTIQSLLTDSLIVRSDAAAPITYAVTYASVGATTMQYRLDVVLEALA